MNDIAKARENSAWLLGLSILGFGVLIVLTGHDAAVVLGVICIAVGAPIPFVSVEMNVDRASREVITRIGLPFAAVTRRASLEDASLVRVTWNRFAKTGRRGAPWSAFIRVGEGRAVVIGDYSDEKEVRAIAQQVATHLGLPLQVATPSGTVEDFLANPPESNANSRPD